MATKDDNNSQSLLQVYTTLANQIEKKYKFRTETECETIPNVTVGSQMARFSETL